MQMPGLFIAFVLLLTIGAIILGSTGNQCSNLEGYDSSAPTNSTSWAGACVNIGTQSLSGFQLFGVAIIVIAAAAILGIIRFLW